MSLSLSLSARPTSHDLTSFESCCHDAFEVTTQRRRLRRRTLSWIQCSLVSCFPSPWSCCCVQYFLHFQQVYQRSSIACALFFDKQEKLYKKSDGRVVSVLERGRTRMESGRCCSCCSRCCTWVVDLEEQIVSGSVAVDVGFVGPHTNHKTQIKMQQIVSIT